MTKQNQKCKGRAAPNGRCRMHGGNFITDAYRAVKKRVKAIIEGPSTRPTSKLTKFLDSHTDEISSIHLGRRPIHHLAKAAFNAVSAGKFSRKAKELNYDEVYHNFLIVTLNNGKSYKLEKNETVREMKATPDDFKNEIFNIPLNGKKLTMKDMITTASAGEESDFYKYRAGSNNCQQFTASMIAKNGLLPKEDKLLELQPADQLLDTLPAPLRFIPNLITDAAAVGHRIIDGDGILIKKKKIIPCPL